MSGEPRPLGHDFFARDVNQVAPDLIGCTLLYRGCGGVIVETESYDQDEPACHGFRGRTESNASIFGPPGFAYVYLSYGIHSLLNFVCEPEGRAAAVLIRALEPSSGLAAIRARRPGRADRELCSGPGKLGEALGLSLADDGLDLSRPPFEILPRAKAWSDPEILRGPRVGISKAVELPWRYCAAASRHVSRPRPVPSRSAGRRGAAAGRKAPAAAG